MSDKIWIGKLNYDWLMLLFINQYLIILFVSNTLI